MLKKSYNNIFSWIYVVLLSLQISNGGNCFLYASYDKEECVTYSTSLNCNFPIYFAVFACIFYGLAQTCYNAYAVYKSTKDPTVG